MVNETAGK